MKCIPLQPIELENIADYEVWSYTGASSLAYVSKSITEKRSFHVSYGLVIAELQKSFPIGSVGIEPSDQ